MLKVETKEGWTQVRKKYREGKKKERREKSGVMRQERKREVMKKGGKRWVKGQGGKLCVHQAGSHQCPDTSVVTHDEQVGKLMSQYLPHSGQRWWLAW